MLFCDALHAMRCFSVRVCLFAVFARFACSLFVLAMPYLICCAVRYLHLRFPALRAWPALLCATLLDVMPLRCVLCCAVLYVDLRCFAVRCLALPCFALRCSYLLCIALHCPDTACCAVSCFVLLWVFSMVFEGFWAPEWPPKASKTPLEASTWPP